MLNVTQTASLLKISDARVRQLILDGTLPAYKCGHSWLLNEEDVIKRATNRISAGRPRKDSYTNLQVTPVQKAPQDQQFHRIYVECRDKYNRLPSTQELNAIKTKEEKAFRVAVPAFFQTRRKQSPTPRKAI